MSIRGLVKAIGTYMSKWRLYGVLVYDGGRLKLVEAVWSW